MNTIENSPARGVRRETTLGLRYLLIMVTLLVPRLAQSAPVGGQSEARRIGSQKQLFIDDLLIESKSNVTLAVNPPVKTGERNIVAEHPWEDLALGYVNILEVGGTYRMWYGCDSFGKGARQEAEAEQENKRVVNLGYATSSDGIRWEKPVLGLVEFRGSRENNLVMTNMFGTVFLDPRTADGNRFKFAGCSRPNRGLEILTSPDGVRWLPFGDKPVLSEGHYDTQNQVFWDESRGKYVSYVRRWEGFDAARSPLCCRQVGRSETDDLSRWPEPEVVYRHDELDPIESDPYNASAVKYPGVPDVYLMFPSAYFHLPGEKNVGPLDIQLATSRDGIKWNRIQRNPYVRLGPNGAFDDGSIYMGVGMFIKGPEIWMYYVAYDYLHGHMDVRKTRYSGVISRVVQRLDGFVSADAAYTGGELTTIPIVFDGRELSLNVDTGAMGEVRVEVLDKAGHIMPGFSAKESDPFNGNYIDRAVTWKGKKDLSRLAGEVVRLRFVMRAAKLYAFQFKN